MQTETIRHCAEHSQDLKWILVDARENRRRGVRYPPRNSVGSRVMPSRRTFAATPTDGVLVNVQMQSNDISREMKTNRQSKARWRPLWTSWLA